MTGKCPVCGKLMKLQPQIDGYGREMLSAAHRVPVHAGRRWGRTCDGSLELRPLSEVSGK